MEIKNKIEKFLYDCSVNFQEIDENTWIVEDEYAHIDNVVIKVEEPILIFRVKLMEAPAENKEGFYKKLLELNAYELLHGAYGLEGGQNVVLVDTLQIENLDFNEFQGSLESIMLAIPQHYKELTEFHKASE